jgi:hypothetical protein
MSMAITFISGLQYIKKILKNFLWSFQRATSLRTSLEFNLGILSREIRKVLYYANDDLKVASVETGYNNDLYLVNRAVIDDLPEVIKRLEVVIGAETEEKKLVKRSEVQAKRLRKGEKAISKRIRKAFKSLAEYEDRKKRDVEEVDLNKLNKDERLLHMDISDLYVGHKMLYENTERIYEISKDLLGSLKKLNKLVPFNDAERYGEEMKKIIIHAYFKELKKLRNLLAENKRIDIELRSKVRKVKNDIKLIDIGKSLIDRFGRNIAAD